MPWALQCDSLETFELIEPIKPIDTFEPFDPQSQWQSDPMTPATGSDEIITFGWAPEHPHKQWSPAAPYPGTGAGCVGVGIGVTSVLGHDERPPSIPSMNVLSIQSPLPFSPYFATSDYHQVY
jgi:hypothetical protein